MTQPTLTQRQPTAPGPRSPHWFDRLAHQAAHHQPVTGSDAQQPDRSPATIASAGQSLHDQHSRRSILQKGFLATAALTLPLKLINPAQASAASCVGACTAKAVKNYQADEKLAVKFQGTGDTLEALNGNIIAASIRADADLGLAQSLNKCDEPNCGKGTFACGPCKVHGPLPGHCCLCNRSPSPDFLNPSLLANTVRCSDYCALVGAGVVSDTRCG